MIKINFNGHVPAKNQTVLRSAVDYFMQDLLSTRKINATFLQIRFVKMTADFNGFCSIHDDEENYNNPKMFSIDVNSALPMQDMIETLAHEMVHMRQFRNKELSYRDTFTRFNGVAYSVNMPYKKHPWEKEAYKLEKSLTKKFLKECV
tara:strand:+ start:2553 stop:2996 length:444 start_codon:yes stop_codon:yes gene_type:complete